MSELYELPDGWEWRKLGDKKVCELIMGQSPKSDTYNSEGKGMPFFQGKAEFGKIYPTVSKYCTSPKKIAEIGDILLSVRAPVGPTNIANIQCCIGRGLAAIRPNQKNTITNYLLYFFRNFEIEISKKGKGSTFSAITKKELENINIPFPPLKEQKCIVAKLDKLFAKIDKAIALHQQNIDEAEVLMGVVLDEVFGKLEERYGRQEIKKLFKIKSGDFLPKKHMITTGNFNVYGGNGINGKHNKFNLSGENIIIGRVGALCGNVRLIKENIWLTDNAFYISEYYKDIDKRFLAYMLKHIDLGRSANQAAQPVISYKSIANLTLPLPPLKTQQKTVQYLDQISAKVEALKKEQKEKMQSLKDLKASILDKAFRGGI